MRRAARCVLAATLCACAPDELPPRGQAVLHVDTDAPLPPGPGAPAPDDAPRPLFDRVRFDVFAPGALEPCADCGRELEIDAELARALRISIGILPEPGIAGTRVRVRIFPARWAGASGATLEAVVAIPPLASEGIERLTVFLPTERVGMPLGTLEAPIDAVAGAPAASLVGTWPGAQRVPCGGVREAGEICIEGAGFWMGDPLQAGLGDGTDADRPRLTVLSPYYLDATEVTVSDVRGSVIASRVGAHDADGTPGDLQWFCTFTSEPGDHDELPVNCVSWGAARDYCRARGADLPTEAQMEHALGATRGLRHPWGNDPPTVPWDPDDPCDPRGACTGAIWGRGGVGRAAEAPSQCRECSTRLYLGLLPTGGPEPVGSGWRDRVERATGTLVDLAGNVDEWVQDVWNRQDEPCWSAPGVHRDPVCKTPGHSDAGQLRSVRGGAWSSDPTLLRAASRDRRDTTAVGGYMGTGFRCARPAAAQ